MRSHTSSGKVSSTGTQPPVNRSTPGARAFGTGFLPVDQSETVGSETPSASARRVARPRSSFSQALRFMAELLAIGLVNVNNL